MVKEEPTREVVKRLKRAGFMRISTEGSHSKWAHPSGPWVSVPDGHRMISPGVVRQVDNAIAATIPKKGQSENGRSDG
ncbi:type II toxin-antitoxin system HicA family toxin [Mycobacterium sp.]|uniref:type II toxin-antitoxin system HicA family toxin n=1 Tax=Mycobacterium sp. TaxID=1785 RepID=UPI002BF23EB7|nr:type II toxin-antitoxin system HicA family toxin [Mycobacterium sp.]HTQ22427.1 type II toxin-antitoxin system HicA family toxin [Mycobacterium sp.]